MLRLALQSGKEGKRGKSATQFGNNNSTSTGLMKEYMWTLVVFIIWPVSHFFILGMALFFLHTLGWWHSSYQCFPEFPTKNTDV